MAGLRRTQSVCEDRNRVPKPEGGLLNDDGADVRFALVGGHAPDPEVFPAKAMNGRASQQSEKAFSPAMVRAERNLAISLLDLT